MSPLKHCVCCRMENITDAMMKLIEENHNGTAFVVSKKGSLNCDDMKRNKELEDWSC